MRYAISINSINFNSTSSTPSVEVDTVRCALHRDHYWHTHENRRDPLSCLHELYHRAKASVSSGHLIRWTGQGLSGRLAEFVISVGIYRRHHHSALQNTMPTTAHRDLPRATSYFSGARFATSSPPAPPPLVKQANSRRALPQCRISIINSRR